MNYTDIKALLAAPPSETWDAFAVLKSVSEAVNNRETHNQGRELVIRCLAVLDRWKTKERQLLSTLVRNVGLFPYMTDSLSATDLRDKLAFELHRADTLGGDVVFHSLQSRIYHHLISGKNVVLSASTSVGKSLVIDAVISSNKYKNIVIIVPTLALIDETRRRLLSRFREHCAVITHPSQSARDNKINVYVLTQERVLAREDLETMDLVVVDEFYKVNIGSDESDDRAIDLNLAFHKLAKQGVQFYMLGPHIHSVRGLDKYEFLFIPSEFSTVAVDVVHFGLPMRGDDRIHKLISLLGETEGSTIVYCQSPASASSVATILADSRLFPESAETRDAVEWISEQYHPLWSVAKALRCGIGVHHGGVPRALQQYFIRLFNQRKIKVLVCTSTIIEGVNTVAQNVIIFDRRKNKNLLDYFTYKNIEGRAGRMWQYFVGKVFVLESALSDESFDVEFPIGEQSPETPFSLLLDLDEEDLTGESQQRIRQLFAQSTLSSETLRKNRHVPIERQEAIARTIREDLLNYVESLSWTGIPTGPQMNAVCKLIFEHLEEDALKDYGISSFASLAWHINELRSGRGLSGYIQNRLLDQRDRETPSNIIESALKFVRNIVCHRFPKDVMVIDAIQRDILSASGHPPGNFKLFAERSENLFMNSSLYALDEYGIPIQTAQSLSASLLPASSLDEVLSKLRRLDFARFHLSVFEKEIIDDVRSSIFV